MATDLPDSFNDQYMTINAKLKKRFLRKPNITEATNEFNALAIQCEHSEQPSFAAHMYLSAAKCENSVGNFLSEAEFCLLAARQFMDAEMKSASLKCYSPVRENLEAAIGCYIQTSNKYPESSPLRTALLMELGHNLFVLRQTTESKYYYEQAVAALADTENALSFKCMCKLVQLHIQLEDYEEALKISNKLCDLEPRLSHEDVLTDIQLNRILLFLIVEPAEYKIPPSLKKLLTELTNEDDDFESEVFPPAMAIRLQSIIMSCNSRDIESLVTILGDTKTCFTIQQQDLFIHLIQTIQNRL